MFNVKALLWTVLTAWILGSTYWYVCKIKLLCDTIVNPALFPTEIVSESGEFIAGRSIPFLTYTIDAGKLAQYATMFTVALLLGFFIGKSYGDKKTTELKYRLSRINREIKYYRSKE
ncbi:hypothetical protein [Dyadobacter sp. CY323]|uniref:hypothetical protein n=1 Tax=Dyadobacter sp. CY323 TaxID=2907302 RepID=UPI001F3D53E3|nr:hypothetical protein [Dyadobacter sp. CY323]MCE6989895.1 hypothetical protein [Dyadobacter sp. CY323]